MSVRVCVVGVVCRKQLLKSEQLLAQSRVQKLHEVIDVLPAQPTQSNICIYSRAGCVLLNFDDGTVKCIVLDSRISALSSFCKGSAEFTAGTHTGDQSIVHTVFRSGALTF